MAQNNLYTDPVIKNPRLKKRKSKQGQQPLRVHVQDKEAENEAKKVAHLSEKEKQKLIEEGRKEGLKEIAKQEIEELPKINELEKMKDRELMRIKNVFPFVLFPDTLIIEENKITFVWGLFFFSKDVRSILIKDIANVTVETSMFFATLNFADKFFENQVTKMDYLKKSEAIKARRLIQGLMISHRENIDFSDIPKHEVIKNALKLGGSDTGT